MEIQKLSLLKPLYYVPLALPNPFAGGNVPLTESERLYCFELDEEQCLQVEPDKNAFLGSFVFGGSVLKDGILKDGALKGGALKGEPKAAENAAETLLELPAGNYLFAQKREILDRESIINAAVEIQQEGLWQRLKPGRRLYLRRLFEDGSEVTQLFRPFS
jgi:hypothetical protein